MSEEMSEIEKYDRAVWKYLSSISPRITYSPTQSAFRTIARREEFSDQKPWNFISFYRSSSFDVDWSLMNNVGTVSGDFVRMRGDANSREVRYVQYLPVTLTYNVELWASKAVTVQELAIKLISKIYMQDQVLEVPINPEGEDGRFHILDVSWQDNSDIERETEIGKIYRHSISFSIDAKLTLVRDEESQKFVAIPVCIYEN